MATVADTLELEEGEVQETFFANGWTDGLPVVPPTPERVEAMLEVVGADDPTVLIGFLPARERGVTLEKAAINAVMAGCLPEYFPVVVAALEAMFDAAFNAAHGAHEHRRRRARARSSAARSRTRSG